MRSIAGRYYGIGIRTYNDDKKSLIRSVLLFSYWSIKLQRKFVEMSSRIYLQREI